MPNAVGERMPSRVAVVPASYRDLKVAWPGPGGAGIKEGSICSAAWWRQPKRGLLRTNYGSKLSGVLIDGRNKREGAHI